MECKHALEGINGYLTCTLLLQHIHYLHHYNKFHQYQGGWHQVDHRQQNIEYLQYITYHRKVLVTHHYHKPHQNHPLCFIDCEGFFVET